MRILSDNPELLELGGRHVVRVDCKCGRVVQLTAFWLIGLHGVDQATRVQSLMGILKCNGCGKRPKLLSVTKWQD
jgi:hypothetical protein